MTNTEDGDFVSFKDLMIKFGISNNDLDEIEVEIE